MHTAIDGMPTPLTLEAILEEGDSSEKPFKMFVGHNLGSRTFLAHFPMHEFFGISEVANDPGRDGDAIAQRRLDPAHAHRLAIYLLKGLVSAAIDRLKIKNELVAQVFLDVQETLGKQPYLSLQPIVVNIRNCNPGGIGFHAERMSTATGETAAFKVFLSQKHVLWVVDGQHRRQGMFLVFEFLDHIRKTGAYPKKGSLYTSGLGEIPANERMVWDACFDAARSYCSVAAEIHLGLSPEEERQLFHDLNNLGKKVEASLALQFDNSNPVNLFIKERLIGDLALQVVEKDVTDWHSDTGVISRKDLVAINAILFLNKTNIGGATPPMVSPKADLAYRFWETVAAIPGFGEDKAKEKTVVAQPVVLKALSKLLYDFSFSARSTEADKKNGEALLSSLTDLDFSHTNPMWRYYELDTDARIALGLSSLSEYLPRDDEGANRDLGSFQNGVMRFGAKHNDIYPILGDMIRWRLNLPNRHWKDRIIETLSVELEKVT